MTTIFCDEFGLLSIYETCVLPAGSWLFLSALAAHASDDMQIYSGRFDNGWGDDWSWMPRYPTNNPVFTSNSVYVAGNSMALVPSGY